MKNQHWMFLAEIVKCKYSTLCNGIKFQIFLHVPHLKFLPYELTPLFTITYSHGSFLLLITVFKTCCTCGHRHWVTSYDVICMWCTATTQQTCWIEILLSNSVPGTKQHQSTNIYRYLKSPTFHNIL